MENVSFCRHCGKPVNPGAAVCLSCGCPPATGRAFCGNCGNPITPQQTVCLKCGVAITGGAGSAGGNMIQGKGKSASTATLLSCLLAGLGQMYLGQVLKGLAILFGGIILSACTAGTAGIIVWIIAMVDANKIGKRLENGESVGPWQFF